MKASEEIRQPQHLNALVVFTDLTGFAKVGETLPPMDLFRLMSNYLEEIGEHIERAGGTVIKFIGDSMLAIFPETLVSDGVLALLKLQSFSDETFGKKLGCRLHVKAHFGPIICGPIGTKHDKRLDVYGSTVNVAALLRSTGFTLSAEAFRKLNPEVRTLFKKHTPPVTYIPLKERHGDRVTQLRETL